MRANIALIPILALVVTAGWTNGVNIAAVMAEIRRAGVEEIHFGWAGGDEFGEPHYYRVQGPTFLIEYDNRQNGANHIHSVWRDLTGDFGQDLLSQHYALSPHHNYRDTYALAGAR